MNDETNDFSKAAVVTYDDLEYLFKSKINNNIPLFMIDLLTNGHTFYLGYDNKENKYLICEITYGLPRTFDRTNDENIFLNRLKDILNNKNGIVLAYHIKENDFVTRKPIDNDEFLKTKLINKYDQDYVYNMGTLTLSDIQDQTFIFVLMVLQVALISYIITIFMSYGLTTAIVYLIILTLLMILMLYLIYGTSIKFNKYKVTIHSKFRKREYNLDDITSLTIYDDQVKKIRITFKDNKKYIISYNDTTFTINYFDFLECYLTSKKIKVEHISKDINMTILIIAVIAFIIFLFLIINY